MSKPPADASIKQPFKGHEPFDKVDPSRFLRFSPEYTTIRNGAMWTRGESGGKYSPFVGIPIDEIDCSISFRYRHLGDGKMLWLFIDGDDGFGGQDHMLRVRVDEKLGAYSSRCAYEEPERSEAAQDYRSDGESNAHRRRTGHLIQSVVPIGYLKRDSNQRPSTYRTRTGTIYNWSLRATAW